MEYIISFLKEHQIIWFLGSIIIGMILTEHLFFNEND